MNLPEDGVVNAKIVFSAYPTDPGTTVQWSFDRLNWQNFDTNPVAQPDGTYVGYVLLRGPNSTSTSGHLVAADSTPLWARVTDSPEIIPLRVGMITFY
jgi:hypothetical protein